MCERGRLNTSDNAVVVFSRISHRDSKMLRRHLTFLETLNATLQGIYTTTCGSLQVL